MPPRTSARAKFPHEIEIEQPTLGHAGPAIALAVAVCLGGGALALTAGYALRAKSAVPLSREPARQRLPAETTAKPVAATVPPGPASSASQAQSELPPPAESPRPPVRTGRSAAPRVVAPPNASASSLPQRARPPKAMSSSNPAFPTVTSAPLRDFENPQHSSSFNRSDELHLPGSNGSGSSFNPALPDTRTTTSPNPAMPNAGSSSSASNPALPNNSGFSFPSVP